VSAHVDPETLADASGPSRILMVDHLAACPACREAVARFDPSLLFYLLSRAPIPERILDAVSAEVSHAATPAPARGGAAWEAWPGTRRAVAAAVAAGAVLTGLAAWMSRGPAPVLLPVAAVPAAAAVEVTPDAAISQVVDMTVGDTQVVMVYNGKLSL